MPSLIPLLAFFIVLLFVPKSGSWADEGIGASDRLARAKEYFGDGIVFDQDGIEHRFVSDLLRDSTVLINVVYTECKDGCPLITRLLGLVKTRLGDQFGKDIIFLSLSSDPNRDTPETLKAFAKKHLVDAVGWRFLSASPTTMKSLLERFGQWTEEPSDHKSLLIAGNVSRAHWVKIRPDASPEFIEAELRRLSEFH